MSCNYCTKLNNLPKPFVIVNLFNVHRAATEQINKTLLQRCNNVRYYSFWYKTDFFYSDYFQSGKFSSYMHERTRMCV